MCKWRHVQANDVCVGRPHSGVSAATFRDLATATSLSRYLPVVVRKQQCVPEGGNFRHQKLNHLISEKQPP